MMKKLYAFLFVAFAAASAMGQTVKITAVNPSTKQITITNFGIATTNLNNYQFCSMFQYTFQGIAAETQLVSGSLNLEPGNQVTVIWSGGSLPIGGADLCLYQPNPTYTNPAHMLSFVQWGSAGNGRESVAAQGGQWVAGTFVTGPAPYTYTGNGTQSGVQFWQNSNPPLPTTNIVINEIDSDSPGTDVLEFVELYGEPNESLDGMVLVFYNGSNDLSYFSLNLDGYSLDANGFFVAGNIGVSAAAVTFPDNTLQNGQDAVALYFGSAAQFPNGTAVTTVGLIDAIVYDTDEADDPGLLALLNPGQPQVNESQGGQSAQQSLSRIPDGGTQRNTDTYVTQAPTPGFSNVPVGPVCEGGTIATDYNQNAATICLDEANTTLQFGLSGAVGDNISFVITDTNNNIISIAETGSYDFGGGEEGLCRVWGIAHESALDPATVEPGMPATGISASGDCVSLSSNFVAVTKQECSTGGGGCGNLFFSEYLEGASNNKALEIYNPTGSPVDLSQYTVKTYANGAVVATNTLVLSGTLAPGDVYVIANAQAVASILAVADITSAVTFFNGDDAVELSQNGVAIDIIGVIGEDPGTSWAVGPGSTENNTLVRNPDIYEGTTNWAQSATQWIVFPNNTLDQLGAHTAIPCTTDPIIGFEQSSMSVNEDAGTVQISVGIANPSDTDVTVEVTITGGTATADEDFVASSTVQITFLTGQTNSQSFDVTIIDDEEIEGSETIVFTLSAVTPTALLGQTEFVLTINPSDQPIPVYDIVDVRGVDANGIADSLGVTCELRGVVYGVNLRPMGLEFTLIDPTSGIGVFKASGNVGYTVTETDSIHVIGTIVQFNGLIQIDPTSIELISTGNNLKNPTEVTELSETTESDLIQINCVSVVDPAQWTNSGAGFNVAITDGDETYTLRVDADTDLFGSTAPEGAFTLVGIGSQFDSSVPHTSGYQLIPRYISDVSNAISASFDGPVNISTGNETADFTATGAGSTYSWDFGDGQTGSGAVVSHTYDQAFMSSNTTAVVTLTVTNADGSCQVTTEQTFNVIYIGIEEAQSFVTLFPNPAEGFFTIQSTLPIHRIVMENAMGQLILDRQNNQSGKAQTDISHVAPGIYLVRVFSGNQTGVLKLLVK